MIAAVLGLALVAANIPPRRADEPTLANFLWYDSPFARGWMACDKTVSRRQQAEFNRTFDDRIARLRRSYEAVNGIDAPIDVVALLTCTIDPTKADAAFRKGMKLFDAKLREFELRYSVAPLP